jgi:hypothetical protein
VTPGARTDVQQVAQDVVDDDGDRPAVRDAGGAAVPLLEHVRGDHLVAVAAHLQPEALLGVRAAAEAGRVVRRQHVVVQVRLHRPQVVGDAVRHPATCR